MTGSLAAYVARRGALLIATLVAVPSASFVMFTLLQGDVRGVGDVLRELVAYLGATFLQVDLGGDRFAGQTFARTRGVLDVIVEGFPADASLLAGGLAVGVALGLLAGTGVALGPRSARSRATQLGTALALSAPVYWVGFVLIMGLAPGTGSLAEIPFFSGVGGYAAPGDDPIAFVRALWVPAVVIAVPLAAMCARMCAATLREALGEEFVRTARAKGLRERAVIARHALPVAAPAVLGVVGVNMNLMITNVALMEVVFNVPGSFRYFDRALANRDVDLVQGMVLEATFFIVTANFVVDALQAWLDPRVR